MNISGFIEYISRDCTLMKSLVVTFLLLCLSAIGKAQKLDPLSIFSDQNQLTFYLLDVENGLSNNYINHIEQDSLGFIWIATIDGLNRYDGHHFRVYQENHLTPHSGPAANYIEHLEIGENQQLLFATNKGFSGYDPKTEKFNHFEKINEVIQSSISYVIKGPNDTKVIANYEGGVHIVDSDSIIFSFYKDSNQSNGLSSNLISSLALQGDSILWVGHFDKGLDKIDLRKNKVISSTHLNRSFPENINTIYPDDKGNLWIGSNDGIRVITTGGDTLQIKAAEAPKFGLSDGNVLCFEKGPFGNLWIGTRNGGLNILNSNQFVKDQTLQLKWFQAQQDGSSVYNRTVASLKQTHDGYMWIGTSTGLNFVNPLGDPVKLISRNLSKKHTISHDRIGSLTVGENESIWIGTDGGGLDHYFPQTGKIEHFEHDPTKASSISNNYILSLLEDSNRNLWVGTYQGGLNLLNPITGNSKHYLQGSQEEGSDVRKIFEGKNGQIWVGTNRGGLYRYHPPIDNFDYVKVLGKIDIRDIAEDHLGNLWLATFGDGIIRYNYLTGEQELFNENTIPGFPLEVVFSIEVLENGDVLAGSRYEGLIRLTPQSKRFQLFTDKDGLSNNSINSLTKGKDGKIWLGTYLGISYFDPETNIAGNLNSVNNIQFSEFNIGASIVTKSGDVYLGGNKGINVFNPESLAQQPVNFPLIFTDLRLMNKKISVKTGTKDFQLERSLPYLKELNLDHDQSLISIDFSVLKFPIGKDINYAYKLEPFHTEWIDTNQNGTANLSNIPPGNYTLKVKANSGNRIISANQLGIIISPPFWKTFPAYLLYIFISASLTIAGMRYYAERLKLRNSLIFEKKQRALEQELNEERIQFFTGFSHELKTPLTLIMAPLEDLLLETKNSKHLKGLNLVFKNAKYLHQMITKLLEFKNSKLNVTEVNLKSHSILRSIKQWADQYQPLAKHKGIDLRCEFPKADFHAMVDLEKLHIIFNNLLLNGLKYCRERDQIVITLVESPDKFELIVSDNGPGIPYTDQSNIFNWYYQSSENAKEEGAGIGLAMTKRLVNDHQGTIQMVSNPGNGTAFSVLIPKEPDISNILISRKSKSEDWIPEQEGTQIEAPSNFNLDKNREVLLIIDDNAHILEYLNNALFEEYDLIFAKNGKEGLEKAMHYIPDLIISDVMMPEKNGIDLCAILKKSQATTHIPVILLSAKDSTESIIFGFAKGADDYITKPFKGQILKSRIRNLLEKKVRMRSYYLGENSEPTDLSSLEKNAVSREKLFLKELEQHILNGISLQTTDVDTISQAMGMSRTSLFRKIKALTGQNINQYIRSIKVVKAASLIKEENLGVAQAAYEVGFTSVKYFRKLFKEQFGHLPSEMKEKNV